MSEEVNSQQSSPPPEDLPITTVISTPLYPAPAFVPSSFVPEPPAPAVEQRAAPRPGLLLSSSAVEPVNLDKFVFQYARFVVSEN